MELGRYMAVLKVRLGAPATVDLPQSEALVPACGADYQSALGFAAAELRALGDEFLDLQGDVQQLDPAAWDVYVAEVWPEFRRELPTQAQVLASFAS